MSDDVRTRLEVLSAEVARLREQLDGQPVPAEPRGSRRNLLKLAAASAAGAGASSLLSASPASANTGDTLLLGKPNTASDTTTLTASAAPVGLQITASTSRSATTALAATGSSTAGSATFVATGSATSGTTLNATASGTGAIAVQATATGTNASAGSFASTSETSVALEAIDQSTNPGGQGLFAQTSSGRAIHANALGTGGVGVDVYSAKSTAIRASTGTDGQTAVSASATAGGTALEGYSPTGYGVVATSGSGIALRVFSGSYGAYIDGNADDAIGVYVRQDGDSTTGLNVSTTGDNSSAVDASASGPSSIGIRADGTYRGIQGTCETDGGVGVYAQASGAQGIGLTGYASSTGGVGVEAFAPGSGGVALSAAGTALDVDAVGSGLIHQQPTPAYGPPSGGSVAYANGTQLRDAAGELYLCVAAGTPGTWVRVTHQAPGFAGGSLNLLAAPFRLVDTRAGASAPVHPGAPIAAGSGLTVKIAGRVLAGATIPPTASAVLCALTGLATATDPTAGLAAVSSAAAKPKTRTVSTPTTGAATSECTVALSSIGSVRIWASAVPIDVVLDVVGFYA